MKKIGNNSNSLIGTIFSQEAAIIAKNEMQWQVQQWNALTHSIIPMANDNLPIPHTPPTITPNHLEDIEKKRLAISQPF